MNRPSRMIGFAGVLLALGWILVAVSGTRSSAEPSPKAPRIRFEKHTHDFGMLRSDQKIEYRWVFHNDGDAPLRILKTRPTCGCTATSVDDKPVPPGESGALEVTLDGAGLHGKARKSLAVMSNDPERPTVILTLLAEVEIKELPQVAGGHPPIAGQSLLMGDCASCHSDPAAARHGEDLYAAICAMCHGPEAEGDRGPSLRSPDYLASHTDEELETGIAFGTANPRMPGFAKMMGGPLDESQVRSLVQLIRSWGPLTQEPDSEK